MSKEAIFTMKLESTLREAFMTEASSLHQPASQVLRGLMRDFIKKQQETRSYEEFLRQKVNKARHSMQAHEGISHEEVSAEFKARRKEHR